MGPSDQISGFLLGFFQIMAIACCVSVSVLGGNERHVFFRETSTGQSVVAYFLSKVIEILTFIPIYTAAFICYSLLKEEWFIQDTGTYYLFTYLVMVFMYAVGFLFSLFLESNAGLISLVTEFMIVFFFSGLLFQLQLVKRQVFIYAVSSVFR